MMFMLMIQRFLRICTRTPISQPEMGLECIETWKRLLERVLGSVPPFSHIPLPPFAIHFTRFIYHVYCLWFHCCFKI